MNVRSEIKAENTFGDVRRWLVDAGVSVKDALPLVPPEAKLSDGSKLSRDHLGKVPGVFNARTGLWSGLSGGHFREGLDDATAHECGSWLTGNLGLRGAVYPAIDSDVLSEKAARVVDRATADCFGLHGYGIRTRDGSPRSLYAFRGNVASRPAAITFRMPDDPIGAPRHVVEVIGRGKHFVAAGVHPNGSKYRWRCDADFCALLRHGELMTVGEPDIARFLDRLERAIEADGGEVIGRSDTRGPAGGNQRHDYAAAEPDQPVEAILEALRRFPNVPTNIGSEPEAFGFFSRLRAALGRAADDPEVVAAIVEWVTADADGFDVPPTAEWFEAKWSSLERNGVEHGQHALRMFLADRGVRFNPAHDFPDDKIAVEAQARNREWLKSKAHLRRRLLSTVADSYVFSRPDASTPGELFTHVRLRTAVFNPERGQAWWALKALISDTVLIRELRDFYGEDDNGFWACFRDLMLEHPDCVYSGLVKNPLHDTGEMLPAIDAQGNTYFELNMRALPQVQKLAARLPKGSGNPDKNDDMAFLLEFIRMVFGKHAEYELDTLAYMVQSKRRPGNMLLLHGDSGTGKSLYCEFLSLIFDNASADHIIPGEKLRSDSARFITAAVEGARILQLRELPETWSKSSRSDFDSFVKQSVDAGRAGDFVIVERKNENARPVKNFARVVAATNHSDAVQISEQDRRIFYVVNGITRDNKPDDAFWARLDALTQDVARLAPFWCFLAERDISDYDPNRPPPVTAGKLERQISGVQNPYTRHAHAVVHLLRRAGRKMVDGNEVLLLMAAAAHNEAALGMNDDRRAYESKPPVGAIKEAWSVVQRHFSARWNDLRKADRSYYPTVYAAPGELADTLRDAPKNEILDALERDKDDVTMKAEHWPATFYGPFRAPGKKGDDFD